MVQSTQPPGQEHNRCTYLLAVKQLVVHFGVKSEQVQHFLPVSLGRDSAGGGVAVEVEGVFVQPPIIDGLERLLHLR